MQFSAKDTRTTTTTWTSDAMVGASPPESLQKQHSFLSNWISLYVYEKGVHLFVRPRRRLLLQRHAIYPFNDNNVILSSHPQSRIIILPTLSLLKLENCRSKHREMHTDCNVVIVWKLNAPYRGQGKESGRTGTLHVAIIQELQSNGTMVFVKIWIQRLSECKKRYYYYYLSLPYAKSSWGFQRTRNSERKLLFWNKMRKIAF